jgi:small subunit ribosomal protein S1
MSIKLTRDTRPDPSFAFSVQPFGVRQLASGASFDFDDFFKSKLAPAFKSLGLELTREDEIYGQGDVAGTAWYGIQKAAVVIVDFTLKRPNVAAEFALALVLGKRIIVITQDPADIPSDVAGHFRYIKYAPDYKEIDHLLSELANEIPAALEQPSSEMYLVPMPGVGGTTTPVPGKVTHAERDHVVVLTDDGRRVVLGSADVDYRRIVPDMGRRFTVGTRVQGSFEVDLDGSARYTMLAGQPNPWPSLEHRYPAGKQFVGTVDAVVPGTGAFVHVTQGVNGLVPEHKMGGRHVAVGDRVEVEVVHVDVTQRRVALRLTAAGVAVARAAATTPSAKVGDVLDTEIVAARPEGKGGYLLVRPTGWRSNVMLHHSAMTAELRSDLNEGLVEVGEMLHVEVTRLSGDKVYVKDRPDLDDEPAEDETAAAVSGVAVGDAA